MISPWSQCWVETICNLKWSARCKWELHHQHWLQIYMRGFLQPRNVLLNYFLCSATLPAPTHCPLTVFFSACLRVKGCVSPSLYTCHLLNLMTQTLTIHLTMMTMTMMTRMRLRRKSQTGHQWVHLSAHCQQSLLSLLFLSVKGSKTTHIECSSE